MIIISPPLTVLVVLKKKKREEGRANRERTGERTSMTVKYFR